MMRTPSPFALLAVCLGPGFLGPASLDAQSPPAGGVSLIDQSPQGSTAGLALPAPPMFRQVAVCAAEWKGTHGTRELTLKLAVLAWPLEKGGFEVRGRLGVEPTAARNLVSAITFSTGARGSSRWEFRGSYAAGPSATAVEDHAPAQVDVKVTLAAQGRPSSAATYVPDKTVTLTVTTPYPPDLGDFLTVDEGEKRFADLDPLKETVPPPPPAAPASGGVDPRGTPSVGAPMKSAPPDLRVPPLPPLPPRPR